MKDYILVLFILCSVAICMFRMHEDLQEMQKMQDLQVQKPKPYIDCIGPKNSPTGILMVISPNGSTRPYNVQWKDGYPELQTCNCTKSLED